MFNVSRAGAAERNSGMEISRQTDYAIRTIEYLARIPSGKLVQTREIAIRQEIPEKYLPTIVRTLARSGILKTMRGNNGGVSLSRPPQEITLRHVVEAIDGPLVLIPNMGPLGPFEDDDNLAILQDFWDRVTEDIRRELDSVRISDLVDG